MLKKFLSLFTGRLKKITSKITAELNVHFIKIILYCLYQIIYFYNNIIKRDDLIFYLFVTDKLKNFKLLNLFRKFFHQ